MIDGVFAAENLDGTPLGNNHSSVFESSRLELNGSNTVGGFSGFDTLAMNVTEQNKGEAALTLTGYALTHTGDLGQTEFNGLTIELTSNEALSSSDDFRLIEVGEGNDQKYTFTDLTVKEKHTFVETTYTADDKIVLSNGSGATDTNALTSKNELFNNKTVSVTENSKTLAESLLGTVAFLNRGAEFIADEGLAAMTEAAKLGEVTAFGVMQGGSTHYETGSYVDVDGVTMMAGASLRVNPNWTLAGFVEGGWGNSSSHVTGARGDADHEYFGLGFATRYQTDGALYVDGSLRAGRATTDFVGRYSNDAASYDAKSLYASAHVALGAKIEITDNLKLDAYGRYSVTYLDDDSFNLGNLSNDKLELESTVTHAVRVGARLLGDINEYASWRVGAAYVHVFDGDAESSVNSLSLDVPSLEGDTGILELGLRIRPSVESPWAVEIGGKGYAGDREGVMGNVMVRYSF